MHVRERLDGVEEIITIGAYTSNKLVQIALNQMKTQPDFLDCPNGFYIAKHKINRDGWCEGFFTYIPGDPDW